MRKLVRELVHAAAGAGVHVDAQQQRQIDVWKTRAGIGRLPARTARPIPVPAQRMSRPKRKLPLYEQVARRLWLEQPCPRCLAAKGSNCRNDDGVGNRSRRQLPHDERLRLIISKREAPNRAEPAAEFALAGCHGCRLPHLQGRARIALHDSRRPPAPAARDPVRRRFPSH